MTLTIRWLHPCVPSLHIFSFFVPEKASRDSALETICLVLCHAGSCGSSAKCPSNYLMLRRTTLAPEHRLVLNPNEIPY